MSALNLVSNVSSQNLSIDACSRNQPNKSKLVLYKPLILLWESIKTVVHK